jgi:hypothetical protein
MIRLLFGIVALLISLLFTSCNRPSSTSPNRADCLIIQKEKLSDYFLIVAVDAKGLEYTSLEAFLTSLQGVKDRSVGHAWIILGSKRDELIRTYGHSGEFGLSAPRYLDEMWYLIKQQDPNPLRVFYHSRGDGVLERDAGGHVPTYAVSISITSDQYKKIENYCERGVYDFGQYNLLNHHCIHFVRSILAIIGIQVDCEVSIAIPKKTTVYGREVVLWTNPVLQQMIIEIPERLQAELQRLVACGIGEVIQF